MNQLNTDEIVYMMQKRKEQAAVNIQRAYRKRREIKKRRIERELAKSGQPT